ncbi:MAG TPA: type II secretion system protein GspL [Gammaproteobacteria bacterium]|nr:type II secretion system protein GspL [Gammaproteobacteria bacterium]
MAEQLLIRIGDADGGARWTVSDAAGRSAGAAGEGPLEEAAALAAGRRVVVLVAAQDVLLTQVALPTQHRQRAVRAVPYALEEQVVGDVEDLHFALGPQQEAGEFAVAVVARALMDRWQSQLRGVGISADLLCPETLALPWREDEWSLWMDGPRALVRTGRYAGFEAEADLLPQMLPLALEEAEPKPARLRLHGDAGLAGVDLGEVECVTESSGDGLALLAAGPAEAGPFNLLQGSYSRRAQVSRLWRPWRATAALLGVVAVVGLTAMGVESYQLAQEQQQLQERISQVFRTTFPKVHRVVDARAQMAQGLEELQRSQQGGGKGFLELLERTGAVLHETPDVRIEGLNYRSGQLDVKLSTKDLHTLDQLKQSLSRKAKLKVDIRSATTGSDKRVQGRLRIAEGGA